MGRTVDGVPVDRLRAVRVFPAFSAGRRVGRLTLSRDRQRCRRDSGCGRPMEFRDVDEDVRTPTEEGA
jgi:hypothetical protein